MTFTTPFVVTPVASVSLPFGSDLHHFVFTVKESNGKYVFCCVASNINLKPVNLDPSMFIVDTQQCGRLAAARVTEIAEHS